MRFLSRRYYLECSAPAPRRPSTTSRPRCRLAGMSARCRWSRPSGGSSCGPRLPRRRRGSHAEARARRPAPPASLHPRKYFLSQAEMTKLFADCPKRFANSVGNSPALQPGRWSWASSKLRLSDAAGMSLEDYLRNRPQDGLVRRLDALYGANAGRAAEENTTSGWNRSL